MALPQEVLELLNIRKYQRNQLVDYAALAKVINALSSPGAIDSDEVENKSTVIGSTVTDALNALLALSGNTFNNFDSTTDPTVNDDNTAGYFVESGWFNASTGRLWFCQDNTTGAAIWTEVTPLQGISYVGSRTGVLNYITTPVARNGQKVFVVDPTGVDLGILLDVVADGQGGLTISRSGTGCYQNADWANAGNYISVARFVDYNTLVGGTFTAGNIIRFNDNNATTGVVYADNGTDQLGYQSTNRRSNVATRPR